MRPSASLSAISTIVNGAFASAQLATFPHIPTPQGNSGIAVFYSSAAVPNTQLSTLGRQIRILQVENTALRGATNALCVKNHSLVVENDALLARNQALFAQNSRLEKDNGKLVDDLCIERSKAATCFRKIRADKNKISRLEASSKQRDLFIRAMIDIKMHQPVFQNAYASIETGFNAEDAIIKAIQNAAKQPGSLWCKILEPPDVAKSDLYLSAIDFAATDRIRLQETIKLASYWKHVAKSIPKNAGLVTPSPSELLVFDKEFQQQRQDSTLDDLLKKPRSGGDGSKKEKTSRQSDILKSTSSSPTLACFQFHRAALSRNHHLYEIKKNETTQRLRNAQDDPIYKDLISSLPSGVLNLLLATMGLKSAQETPKSREFNGPPDYSTGLLSYAPASSLERIHAAFTSPDSATAFDEESTSSQGSLTRSEMFLKGPLPSQTSVTSRGRSATFPFSARDLVLPPMKNVTSKQVILTPPGDKEKQAQSMLAHRARFDEGTSVRSKGLIHKRSLGSSKFSASISSTPVRKATPSRHNSQSKVGKTPLAAPSPDDSFLKSFESSIRPPTITRGRVPNTPASSAVVHPVVLPVQPSVSEQKIKPYVVKGPKLLLNQKLRNTAFDFSFTPSTSDTDPSPDSSMTPSRVYLTEYLKRKPGASATSSGAFEAEKENIPPQMSPMASRRSSRNPSRILSRVSAPRNDTAQTRKSTLQSSRLSPAVKGPTIPYLKPTQTLRIAKKEPTRPFYVTQHP